MTDSMDLLKCNLTPGQLVMVETQTEILVGNLKLISRNGQILQLDNARDFNTNYHFTSTQFLPKPMIKAIKTLNENEDAIISDDTPTISTSKSDSPLHSSSPSSSSSSSSVSHPNELELSSNASASTSGVEEANSPDSVTSNRVQLSNNELLIIENLLKTTKFIFQTDQSYHKAIDDLRTQFIISLHLETTEMGRHSRTSLIAVATSHQVYVFDFICFGSIFHDLRQILESERPKKIVHYAHKIVDNLKHRHDIALGGIFDTFVAHCLVSKRKAIINLEPCIQKYFNISEQYFKLDLNEEPLDPCRRPLPKEYIQLASKKTIFLYKLYENLLHGHMLAKFYAQCNDFSTVFTSNTNPLQVAMHLGPKSTHGLERIDCTNGWDNLLD